MPEEIDNKMLNVVNMQDESVSVSGIPVFGAEGTRGSGVVVRGAVMEEDIFIHLGYSIDLIRQCSVAAANIKRPKESINFSSYSSTAKGCDNVSIGDSPFLHLTGLETGRILL